MGWRLIAKPAAQPSRQFIHLSVHAMNGAAR